MHRKLLLSAVAISLIASSSARALDRLLVLDRWQTTPGFLNSIAKIDLFDPMSAGSTIQVSTTGTLWSMPAPVVDLHSLAVHPISGQLYSVARLQSVAGVINAMVAIDRDTGALTYIGAPSLETARFRFHPVTLAFHWVNGKTSRTYSAPGGSSVFNPDLFFAVDDVNAGASPSCAGFAFEPPMAGDLDSTAYLLDVTTDSLCVADFATSELRTVGALGIDLTGLVAGPVVELGGEIFFAADLGAGPRFFEVDAATGVATDVGEFPAFHGITDLALEPVTDTTGDFDGDGYPDRVEVAGGSSAANPASSPFDGFPVAPAPTDSPLLSKSLRIELDFVADDSDRVVWKGRLPVAPDFVPEGQRLIAEIGGYAVSFTLGKKGKAKGASDGASVEVSKKVKNGSVSLKVKLAAASLETHLADEGLIDADLVATPLSIPLAIYAPGVTYAVDVIVDYTATTGVGGEAK